MNVSDDPSLVISIYNEKKQILEVARDVRSPAFLSKEDTEPSPNTRDSTNMNKKSGYIFWGQSWHMQTPLENLEANSYLLIEYRPRGEGLNVPNLNPVSPLIAQYFIDLDTLDSGLYVAELLPGSDSGRQSNSAQLQNEKSILSLDILLTRKNKPIDINTILNSAPN
jgi:hypothetical protein